MDASKNILNSGVKTGHFFLISAENQTEGRGTQGRKWISEKGNIFLTIAIHLSKIQGPDNNNKVGLLPLIAGIFIHNTIQNCLPQEQKSKCVIKWPNDILVGEQKISGMLIEKHQAYFLWGIGINTAKAPLLGDESRETTSLNIFGYDTIHNTLLIKTLFNSICNYFNNPISDENLLSLWKEKMDWAKPVFKKEDQAKQYPLSPIDITKEGLLIVEDVKGLRSTLSSTYLY